jgi:hypothetical protein
LRKWRVHCGPTLLPAESILPLTDIGSQTARFPQKSARLSAAQPIMVSTPPGEMPELCGQAERTGKHKDAHGCDAHTD